MSVVDFITVVSFAVTMILLGYNLGKDKRNDSNKDVDTDNTRK
jgi:hypothetical protein